VPDDPSRSDPAAAATAAATPDPATDTDVEPARTPPAELARVYLEAEFEALEPFDFVSVSPATNPLHALEVARREDEQLEVRVPGRPMPMPALPVPVRSRLRELGLSSEDPADQVVPWLREVADSSEAFGLAERLLRDAFQEKPDVRLNIIHGSRRAQHEAELKLATIKRRIEKILTEMMEEKPTQDDDGDHIVGLGDVRVVVGARIAPGGLLMVRVFAITNVDVTISPELGLFLARLNFGLMFGRFALNTERRSIWFDETLLGEHFSDEELRFTVRVVASTADEWDDRLKQMFGGSTHQEDLSKRLGEERGAYKPGYGTYL